MQSSIPARLVVSDSRKASLYTGSLSRERADSLPRVRLELADVLRSPWEDFHEHGRPSALGRGPSANAAQHFAGGGHEREELKRRFAVEVASWIARKSAESPEAAVVAFADPRFLGHLRGACSALRLDVAVERGEFSWLRPAELGAHPSIRAALGSAAFRPAASP
jgi:protein required for attachment to host cells